MGEIEKEKKGVFGYGRVGWVGSSDTGFCAQGC